MKKTGGTLVIIALDFGNVLFRTFIKTNFAKNYYAILINDLRLRFSLYS